MRTRTFVVVGVAVALLIAGVASYVASTNPDGLEYVAEQAGFAETAKDSATADSPLSDYQVRGVEDEAASGALAGMLGALVVLVVAGGLTYLVRRRGPSGAGDPGEGDPAEEREPADPVERSEERG
ncbi:MAG TPA: PDGLE domain-containing protein [Nocardioidaceae bacterium]